MTKKKKFTVCVTACLLTICSSVVGQSDTNSNNKNNVMKFKFNLEEFKPAESFPFIPNSRRDRVTNRRDSIAHARWQGRMSRSGYRGVMIKGDTIRSLREDRGFFFVSEQIGKNNAFSTRRRYSKSSLMLLGESRRFYNLPIVSKTFDDEGNLINTRNFEKERNYSFTVEMLVEKFKTEFDIDLTVRIGFWMDVRRLFCQENKIPMYGIRIPLMDADADIDRHLNIGLEPIPEQVRIIHINGITGELISDETLPFRVRGGTVFIEDIIENGN